MNKIEQFNYNENFMNIDSGKPSKGQDKSSTVFTQQSFNFSKRRKKLKRKQSFTLQVPNKKAKTTNDNLANICFDVLIDTYIKNGWKLPETESCEQLIECVSLNFTSLQHTAS